LGVTGFNLVDQRGARRIAMKGNREITTISISSDMADLILKIDLSLSFYTQPSFSTRRILTIILSPYHPIKDEGLMNPRMIFGLDPSHLRMLN
jgi:hypothetical protein